MATGLTLGSGPDDPTPLRLGFRQAGATDVVTALHDMPNGTAWPEAGDRPPAGRGGGGPPVLDPVGRRGVPG